MRRGALLRRCTAVPAGGCPAAAAAAAGGRAPVVRPFAPSPPVPAELLALRADVDVFPTDGGELGACPTAPAPWYTDPRFLELEKRSVFASSWLHVGSAQELPAEGSYFTRRVVDEPIIVVREQGTGDVRAWYNVCSHHAMRVAEGRGQCSTFVCPYHGWTYGTDGRLRRATTIKGMRDFSARDYGLVPINCALHGGLVFVNFSPSPPRTLAEQLAPLDERLAATTRHEGWGNLLLMRRRVYEIECNWKVFIDNYCDGGYHVPYAHKDLASNVEMADYRNEIHDWISVQSVPTTQGDARTSGGACYAYCYPNMMVNRYGPWLDTNTVVPLGVSRCRVIFDYYLDRSSDHSGPQQGALFVDNSLQSSHQVQLEDIQLCEGVQRGLSSRAYVQGRYNPTFEAPMHHFHCLLRRQYGDALDRAATA